MAFRPPRFFFHPGQTFTPKTLLPLVARLGADSIFLAESAKIERPHRSHCKLHSLFHRFTFLPRHAEVLPHHTTKSVTYVLNLSCYLCSEPAPSVFIFCVFSPLPALCRSSTPILQHSNFPCSLLQHSNTPSLPRFALRGT